MVVKQVLYLLALQRIKPTSSSPAATGLVFGPWSVVHGSIPLHTSALPAAAGHGRFCFVEYAVSVSHGHEPSVLVRPVVCRRRFWDHCSSPHDHGTWSFLRPQACHKAEPHCLRTPCTQFVYSSRQRYPNLNCLPSPSMRTGSALSTP